MADEDPLSFVRLWDSWDEADQRLETFKIIMTEACSELSEINHRQPAIIQPYDFDFWLDSETPEDFLLQLIRTPLEGPFGMRGVSKRVNSPRNNDPEILPPSGD